MKNIPPKAICSASPLLLMLGLLGAPVLGAPVSQDEAVRVADLWYAMELNSDNTRLDRAERMRLMPSREVLYLVAADSLFDTPLVDRPTLAYVVKYRPHGYVVVAGDDRLSPIMVFSTESDFSWENPERNFLRHFINTAVPARWQQPGAATDRRWLRLRSKAGANLESVTFDTDDVHLVWNTPLWGQEQWYNDTCVAHNGGNGVPTGCVATAMAIKMKFHEWPPTGNGSHSYNDNWDSIRYSHSVDYGATAYNWLQMPLQSLTSPNHEVARVMYHAGVSVNMNYEVDESGASTLNIGWALCDHFRYKGAYMSTDNHLDRARTSILARSPVNMGGYGHSVVADGYREPAPDDSFFHVNAGWDGTNNGWYCIAWMPPGGSVSASVEYAVPENWFYVAHDAGSTGYGLITQPYRYLSEGQGNVPVGGWMLIKEGLYTGSNNVPVTLSGAKTIVSYNVGTANIDGKLALFEDGRIDITGNGQVRIY